MGRVVAETLTNPNITASVSSTISNKTNYAEFNVTGAGRLILIDYAVNVHSQKEYLLKIPNLPADTPENIIVIENATLINPNNVAEVADRLLRYFQQPYEMEVGLIASTVDAGDSVKIATQKSKNFAGVANYLGSDLVRGMLQRAKARGNILPISETDWYIVEYLIVGGGASGGVNNGGGGGAGALAFGIEVLEVGNVYSVTAGKGGAASSSGNGNDGNDSTFLGVTAEGGGYGGGGSDASATPANAGGDGGNGGGGGGNSDYGADGAGGDGTQHDGGDGSNGETNFGGGGGGGADEDGTGGQSVLAPDTCDGGDGREYDISGTDTYYAGGGGGCGQDTSGDGGNGGGGDGNKDGNGVAGTHGRGGGGGGAKKGFSSGRGGNGVVIMRVPTKYYSGTQSNATVTTDGDYKVLTWENTSTLADVTGSYTA